MIVELSTALDGSARPLTTGRRARSLAASMTDRARLETLTVAASGLLFLLSGAAALVYQVAWQRLLALHSGVGLYSVAMIVAAFMAGLGIGSELGGRSSLRLSGAGALFAFAGLELLIGGFGAASTYLYYDWLYPVAVHLESPSLLAGLLHLAALLPPTVLMGMSLPFLVQGLVRDVEGAARRIGWLYGLNVVGAAFGAWAAPWLLLPRLGVRGAVLAAAVINVIVALGAALLGLARRRGTAKAAASTAGTEARSERATATHGLGLWLGLYALSGFVALSLEVVWFRLLDVAAKSTAFTFGTLLSIYLLGSAVGALAAAALLRHVQRPLRAFLLLQCAILALAAAPAIALVRVAPNSHALQWFVRYWADYSFFPLGHQADWTSVLRLYLELPLLLFFLPTVLMGASFPVLQRAVHDDPRTSGRKVGALQAANIAGCTAGSLLVGLVSLQHLGTAGTLRLLLLLGLVFVAVGLRAYGRSFLLAGVLLIALAAALPRGETLWRRLHGVVDDASPALFEEDATGVVAVTPDGAGWRLSVNGKGNSWLPYGSGPRGAGHMLLGAVPACVHPAPLEIAVVGLGSGDTAWAAACRRETLRSRVFEISSPQPRALRRAVALADLEDTRRLLEDPRVTILIQDGRKALEAEDRLYDLIEADATWPETSGSGNLYSLEFFEAAARRLKPGGVMCTWAPTQRVRRTFRAVFPYLLENADAELLVGSPQPIAFQPASWRARADDGRAILRDRAPAHPAGGARRPAPGRLAARDEPQPRPAPARRVRRPVVADVRTACTAT